MQVFYLDVAKLDRGVAHVAMHMRRGEGASGPYVRSGGAGPAWARKIQARAGRVGPSAGNRVQRGCPNGHPGATIVVNLIAVESINHVIWSVR